MYSSISCHIIGRNLSAQNTQFPFNRTKYGGDDINMRHIIFCRGISEKSDLENEYINTFNRNGFTAITLPTLRFEFVNIDILRECLLSPDLYKGLIITSKRAARAIILASQATPNILQAWKSLPVYCVGPASQSIVKEELGFDNCIGSESGNAEELSNVIIEHYNVTTGKLPLLYPCNEIARETIQQRLEACDIPMKKIISYKPFPSETLEKDIVEGLSFEPNILIVFFSPSMVDLLTNVFKKLNIDKRKILAVAIGPVTEKSLIANGFDVYASAKKPEPDSLLQAVLEAEKKKNS